MRLCEGGAPGADSHLTYCTNIHAGERWAEVKASLATHVVAVKARVCPDRPFGVGLRLGAQAARELARGRELDELEALLAREGLYVFTLNGFPHGCFHDTAVKETVYRPDWRERERLDYSDALAGILARLLPEGGVEGSISTVPGCFRPRASDAGAEEMMADHIVRHAATLWRIAERTGKVISLALEPEPCCFLETVPETVAFFERRLLSAGAVQRFAELTGTTPGAGDAALRRHLGVCLDACHAAVEFEEPAEAVRALSSAGIRIGKIQLSTGLRVVSPDADARRALSRFDDGVYLHQVVARSGGGELTRFLDLPEAIERGAAADEWRVHFHVPIFRERLGPFENTQPFLAELLDLQAAAPCTTHLEVETYTWDVLPEEHRGEPVACAIARELRWARERLGAAVSSTP
jgi:sugar phosphate isomerase/epimerase